MGIFDKVKSMFRSKKHHGKEDELLERDIRLVQDILKTKKDEMKEQHKIEENARNGIQLVNMGNEELKRIYDKGNKVIREIVKRILARNKKIVNNQERIGSGNMPIRDTAKLTKETLELIRENRRDLEVIFPEAVVSADGKEAEFLKKEEEIINKEQEFEQKEIADVDRELADLEHAMHDAKALLKNEEKE